MSNVWTVEKYEEAAAMRLAGSTWREIAQHYGVSKERARQVVAKAGRLARNPAQREAQIQRDKERTDNA